MKRKLISSVLALCCTMSCISAVSVFASEDYNSKYIQTIKAEDSIKNENFIGVSDYSEKKHICIDTKSDEFKTFVENACKTYIKGDNVYFISCVFLGYNENGEALISDNPIASGYELDENNNPVVVLGYGDPATARIYGYNPEYGAICAGINRLLIRVDENGEFQIINAIPVSNSPDITKTIDIDTGKEILVKDISFSYHKVIETGDATTDGEIDVRDVTLYNQHAVKLKEIPDYAEKVADINSDGTIDLKDLGLIKQYIIGLRDSL